jgi:predicted transcriptional regulator
MAPFAVPDAVREFVQRNIDSVEELEILLWLRRSGQEATLAELAEKLRSTNSSVATRLEHLAERGLVAPGAMAGSYRYVADSASLDETVAVLGDCYRDAPHKIMELVYSKPVDKIQTFADAFRLGKKEKG